MQPSGSSAEVNRSGCSAWCFGSSALPLHTCVVTTMQMLKSLTPAALFGSFIFQLQGCGGDDDDTTVGGGTTVAPTTAEATTTTVTTAAAGGGNSTRRLEFDFTFNAAEDVHV